MQKIVPNLWFDSMAEEAVQYYISVFGGRTRSEPTRYTEAGFDIHGMAAGTVMTESFEIDSYEMLALNGGPDFSPNPSISFIVNCATAEEVDEFWEPLSEGGTILMPLDKYFFSDRCGWVQDRYGFSWQIMTTNPEGDWRPRITPSLTFVGAKAGKAEEAMNHYTSIFPDSEIGMIARYPADSEPDQEGTVMYGDFKIAGQWFAAMDSAREHDYDFNEAVSFIINCQDQEEIDHYWERLSEGGDESAQECGWLKDKYGVSWQVVPTGMEEILNDPDPAKAERAMNALLGMKKIDLAALNRALE